MLPPSLAVVPVPTNQPVLAIPSSKAAAVSPQPAVSAFDDFSGWVKLFTNSSAINIKLVITQPANVRPDTRNLEF